MCEADASCAPDAEPPAIRSARPHAAAHTGAHRWLRQTAACSCRQDTTGRDVPQCRQMPQDILPQPWGEEFPRSSRVMCSGGRVMLRRPGTIGMAARGVPSHLAAQGARGSSHDPRHRSERMVMGQPQTQRLTLFSSQVFVRSRWHGNTIAHPGWQCCPWSWNSRCKTGRCCDSVDGTEYAWVQQIVSLPHRPSIHVESQRCEK